MSADSSMSGTTNCSENIKLIGSLAVGVNAVAGLGILMFDFQTGGHGEMGSFYRSIIGWILLLAVWGLATGVGLLRAWRWARISALIFSGLLTAFGIVGVVAFLFAPGGDFSAGTLVILKAVFTLQLLIPVGIGIRWSLFFTRKDVKAHFHERRSFRPVL